MKTSKYLFDHGPERYAAVQRPLAKLKMHDAKKLMWKLARKIDHLSNAPEQNQLRFRFDAAKKAHEHWKEILGEANGEER